jgi:hypothetical protein
MNEISYSFRDMWAGISGRPTALKNLKKKADEILTSSPIRLGKISIPPGIIKQNNLQFLVTSLSHSHEGACILQRSE